MHWSLSDAANQAQFLYEQKKITEHVDVSSVPVLKRQKVGENIIQQHHICAIPIRAPTINSLKGQNNPSIVANTSDVNFVNTKVGSNKSRSQILRIIDQVVHSYNSVNFESLLRNISTSSIQDVLLKVRLTPGSIDPPPNLQSSAATNEYVTKGVPSIFLLWMLFHETHPDGVMNIVDRRICYRQILNKIPASQVYPSSNVDPGKVNNRTKSISPHSSGAPTPVSIVEAVLRFSGSCITSQPLQDLYCALAVGEWTRLAYSDKSNNMNSNDVSNIKSAIPASLKQQKPPPPSDVCRISPVLCSEFISSFLTRKQLLSTALSSTATRNSNNSSSSGYNGTEASAPLMYSATQCVHERGRQYLLEVRLVLDECDLVTEWAVSVLASESC